MKYLKLFLLACSFSLPIIIKAETKDNFTRFVDLIEELSNNYINPVLWGSFGIKTIGPVISNGFKFHRDMKSATCLKPNLIYTDPLEHKACALFNEVAQKVNENGTITLMPETSHIYNASFNKSNELFFKKSYFAEPLNKEKIQSNIAYHIVKNKYGYGTLRDTGKLVGYPLLLIILYSSGRACHHLFKTFFKDEFTKENSLYLKDIQRLMSLILESPLTFIVVSGIIFSKWDTFITNKIHTQAAELIGPSYIP